MTKDADEEVHLRLPRKEAKLRLQKQINDGQKILSLPVSSDDDLKLAREKLREWVEYNNDFLAKPFTTNKIQREFTKLVPSLKGYIYFSKRKEEFYGNVRMYLTKLRSIRNRLDLFEEGITITDRVKSFGNKVFIVHGHDVAAKQAVAYLLKQLDLDVVILHEKPDKGRTIIEKLLEESDIDVGYAVVVLTPDDVGRVASEEGKLSPRARQNVVLELGYFLAKLGKERVHALYKEGVELPTDYLGVLYTPLDDAGSWQLKLAKELKAIGFSIDLNKLTG